MPSLTSVVLVKKSAFQYKNDIHTKSISSITPSPLDITPALDKYLHYSSFLQKQYNSHQSSSHSFFQIPFTNNHLLFTTLPISHFKSSFYCIQ